MTQRLITSTLRFLIATLEIGLAGFSPPIKASFDADLPAAVKEIFRSNCFECHAGENAIAGVRILNHESLLDNGHIEPGKPDSSYIYELITSTGADAMPPQNRPALTENQITTIRKWIVAGANAFPDDLDPSAPPQRESQSSDATPSAPKSGQANQQEDSSRITTAPTADIIAQILGHVRKTPPQDRPFLRFFSLSHLLASGTIEEQLALHRRAFTKAINHLSKEPNLVVPTPVNQSQSILAVDIRQLGWHQQKLTSLEDASLKLNLHDLILLEYPYAVLPTNSAEPNLAGNISDSANPALPY